MLCVVLTFVRHIEILTYVPKHEEKHKAGVGTSFWADALLVQGGHGVGAGGHVQVGVCGRQGGV